MYKIFNTISSDVHNKTYLKTLRRDIKLGLLIENNYSINIEGVSDILDFIINNKMTQYIISGSVALKIYGLLDRDFKDVDLITTSIDREGYLNNEYPISARSNRLGFLKISDKFNFYNIFSRKSFNFDFFLDEKPKFKKINYNGHILKIQELSIIIDKKIEIIESIADDIYPISNWKLFGYKKHISDLEYISNKLNNYI